MTTFYDSSFRKVHLVMMRLINPIVRENFDSLYKMSFVDNAEILQIEKNVTKMIPCGHNLQIDDKHIHKDYNIKIVVKYLRCDNFL